MRQFTQIDRGQVLRDGGPGSHPALLLRDDVGGRLVRDEASAGGQPLLSRQNPHRRLLPRDVSQGKVMSLHCSSPVDFYLI